MACHTNVTPVLNPRRVILNRRLVINRITIILLFFLLSYFSYSERSLNCNGYYATPRTSLYIDALNDLLKKQVIVREDLKFLYEAFLMGSYENPVDVNRIRNRIDFQELIKYSELFDELINTKRKKLVRSSIMKVIKNNLEKKRSDEFQELYKRSFVLDNTLREYYDPDFITIEPGQFIHRKGIVKLDHRFQVLSTPVSQGLFYKVLGYNPSIGLNEDNSAVKDGVHLMINAPVNGLRKMDVYRFFKNLNDIAKNNKILIEELMPGHHEGMRYRPLSMNEWQFLMRESNGGDDFLGSMVNVRVNGTDPFAVSSIYSQPAREYRGHSLYGLGEGYQEVSADLSVRYFEREEKMNNFWNSFFRGEIYKSNFNYTRFMTMYKSILLVNGEPMPVEQNSLFVDPSVVDLNSNVTFRIIRYYPKEKKVIKKHGLIKKIKNIFTK